MTEVRIVNNYSFLDEKGIMVDLTNKKTERYHLFGKNTDKWAKVLGTEHCVTSSVHNVTEDGKVSTEYSMYQLGTISPDYQEFLESNKKGILYVANWSIYGDKSGYYLRADIYPKKKFIAVAKIVSQNGNFLTIQRITPDSITKNVWKEPETIFVCWNVMSYEMISAIRNTGKVADDLYYDNFQEFNGKICRPILKI